MDFLGTINENVVLGMGSCGSQITSLNFLNKFALGRGKRQSLVGDCWRGLQF